LQAAVNEDSSVLSLGAVHSFLLGEVYRYFQSATVKEILIWGRLCFFMIFQKIKMVPSTNAFEAKISG